MQLIFYTSFQNKIMSKQKVTRPEVVIALTDEQQERTAPLHDKQRILNAGYIFGSLSLDGKYIALSYHPQHVGEKVRDFVYDEMGGNDDGDSKETDV